MSGPNKGQWARVTVGVSVVALLVSACGSASPSSSAVASAAPTSAPTSASTSAPSAEATVDPASLSGTIAWRHWDPGVPLSDPTLAIADFNTVYPNIKIDWTQLQWQDYIQELQLQLPSGEGADVFGLSEDTVAQYKDYLEDLTPYAEKTWGSNWKDMFIPGTLDQQFVDGKLVGLPQYYSCAGSIFYNKTMFEGFGLKAPTTFDELVAVVDQLKAKGVKAPFVQGAKDGWINTDTLHSLAAELAPGVMFEANAGKKPWTDPGLVAAMAKWGEFSQKVLQPGALGISQYPDAFDQFTKGEAGMIMLGQWQNGQLTRAAVDANKKTYGFTDDYVAIPISFPDVNGDGKLGSYVCGAHAMSMYNQSKNKDLAWAWLTWWVDPTGGQKWTGKQLNSPVVKGASIDMSDVAFPDQKKALDEQAAFIAGGGYAGPRNYLNPLIGTALADAMQAVAAGTKTPEAALADVQAVSDTVAR